MRVVTFFGKFLTFVWDFLGFLVKKFHRDHLKMASVWVKIGYRRVMVKMFVNGLNKLGQNSYKLNKFI